MINVKIEQTPNPQTMKFQFMDSISSQNFEATSVEEAFASPLAMKLFGFPWTKSVFISDNFVTVTKQEWVDWDILAEPLASLLREHIESGEGVLNTPSDTELDSSSDEPMIIQKIKRTLKNEIRPVVALDGGDIEFSSFDSGILYLQMKGACSGCPSSQITLKEGIETRMKELYPEIQGVEAV